MKTENLLIVVLLCAAISQFGENAWAQVAPDRTSVQRFQQRFRRPMPERVLAKKFADDKTVVFVRAIYANPIEAAKWKEHDVLERFGRVDPEYLLYWYLAQYHFSEITVIELLMQPQALEYPVVVWDFLSQEDATLSTIAQWIGGYRQDGIFEVEAPRLRRRVSGLADVLLLIARTSPASSAHDDLVAGNTIVDHANALRASNGINKAIRKIPLERNVLLPDGKRFLIKTRVPTEMLEPHGVVGRLWSNPVCRAAIMHEVVQLWSELQAENVKKQNENAMEVSGKKSDIDLTQSVVKGRDITSPIPTKAVDPTLPRVALRDQMLALIDVWIADEEIGKCLSANAPSFAHTVRDAITLHDWRIGTTESLPLTNDDKTDNLQERIESQLVVQWSSLKDDMQWLRAACSEDEGQGSQIENTSANSEDDAGDE